MRLQTGKIVLKYIENFVRREREAVNRFRDFLSDVVRQSDMVLLSLCTVSTLYGMVLIASATHFRNTFKYVAIQGFGLLLGVLLYFLLSSIDVSEVGKKWKWLLAFNLGFILLLRTPFGLTRNGNRAWLGVNDIGKRLGVGFLEGGIFHGCFHIYFRFHRRQRRHHQGDEHAAPARPAQAPQSEIRPLRT